MTTTLNTIDDRLELWSKERDLIKQPEDFDVCNEAKMLLEEIIELLVPIKSEEARELAGELLNALSEENLGLRDTTVTERINALCDIQIFAKNAVRKLGYHSGIALEETVKEIESRSGKLINGKFEKDMTIEHTWYTPDYEIAKVL